MTTFVIIIVVLIGVASLVGTLYAGRQVNQTIDKMEQATPEEQESLAKANYYKSHRSNFKLLTMIYLVLFVIAIIAFAVYLLAFK
ncbi:hypothetical protein ACFO4N_02970 [Camelliibacillus cellulosilyticus]|uniref:Uncharacterized protein n=1 Tax=Camelliibacillus cellulosilyticus TaxID=2174486 RepID=A0ABV9GKL8_9BACL